MMTADDGSKTTWVAEGDRKYYVVGKRVKILHVWEELKSPLEIRDIKGKVHTVTHSESILEIWVES